MRKAIFLDRDGVINVEIGRCPIKFDEFQFIDKSIDAIKLINRSEYLVVVVTNQGAVSRGFCTSRDIEIIHENMEKVLGNHGTKVDAIYYCPHYRGDGCECRKPKTGMIERAVKDLGIELHDSYLIGDSSKDIECGKNCNLITIGVQTGNSCKDGKVEPLYMFKNLYEAVRFILKINPINIYA